jgi:hypothetical protein
MSSNNQTTDLVETFLNNQTKELEIKAEQLALQKQENEHGFEFGKVSLKAKVEDRNLHRKYALKTKAYTYTLIGIVVLSVFGIIFYAMYSGNKDIAMEIIKAIVYLLGGGLGGYGIAKAGKAGNSNSNNAQK